MTILVLARGCWLAKRVRSLEQMQQHWFKKQEEHVELWRNLARVLCTMNSDMKLLRFVSSTCTKDLVNNCRSFIWECRCEALFRCYLAVISLSSCFPFSIEWEPSFDNLTLTLIRNLYYIQSRLSNNWKCPSLTCFARRRINDSKQSKPSTLTIPPRTHLRITIYQRYWTHIVVLPPLKHFSNVPLAGLGTVSFSVLARRGQGWEINENVSKPLS